MANSWQPAPFVEPAARDGQTVLESLTNRLVRTFSDLPFLSRHVGHLTILLLLLVIQGFAPRGLPTPSLNLLTVPRQVKVMPQDMSEGSFAAPNSERYLQSQAVPLTTHSMREVLPFAYVQPSNVRTTVLTYRVQEGDTVLGIAEKFNLSGNSILWANEKLDENPDFLSVGQELYILPVDGAYHTVAAGETIEQIASRYKVKPEVIYGYGANNLTPPYTLQAGQKLIIPGGTKPYVPRQVVAYAVTSAPAGAKKGSGIFAWPMSGVITQRYWAGHQAIDIGAPVGTAIVAADAGFVAVVQRSNVGYGRMVIIDHGNGYQTLYAHLNTYYVEAGQSVGKGQVIGTCGVTGNTTGPHLHFEILRNGVRLNPFNHLP